MYQISEGLSIPPSTILDALLFKLATTGSTDLFLGLFPLILLDSLLQRLLEIVPDLTGRVDGILLRTFADHEASDNSPTRGSVIRF